MDADKYLEDVLKSQTLDDDGEEMKALCKRKGEVEKLLKDKFTNNPTIRFAGSKTKGTMIRESYDLDITCYFKSEDTQAGDSLKDIYQNVRAALQAKYTVESKASALRLRGLDHDIHGVDFHIDVVPGRFSDDKSKDVFLHRENDDKVRLKTNPDVHVEHVRDSGVRDAIRLAKLWRERNGVGIKSFVLELLVVDLLREKKDRWLQTQMKHLWTEFRDHSASLSVKDPANPEGNDLSSFLGEDVRNQLMQIATRTMEQVDADDWEKVYGKVGKENASAMSSLLSAAITSRPTSQTFKPFAG
jgi:hypothetical protein